jgi:hypothetical protein
MFAGKLIPHAPHTRCYSCGSADIVNVCHHCARGICADDSPRVLDTSGKPMSLEFDGLGLAETGEAAIHCHWCAHVVRRRSHLLLIGVLICVAGLLLLKVSIAVGIVGLIAGSSVGIYGYITNQRRAEEAFESRPPLPLFPRTDSIQVTEKLEGRITLDAKTRYRSWIAPPVGELRIAATLAQAERERIHLYRRKYRLSDEEPIKVDGGVALLKGRAGLRFHGAGDNTFHKAITITGDSNAAFMTNSNGNRTGAWPISLDYQIEPDSHIDQIPIWLTPSLSQEAARRGLELDLQWTDFGLEENSPTIERVDKLRLELPIEWGNVENVTNGAVIGKDVEKEPFRTVEWRQLPISESDRKAGHRAFFIRFEHPIELKEIIRGHLDLTFNGSLSGLKAIELFSPLGQRRSDMKHALIRTEVAADFELSLSALRYQDVRVIPDQKVDSDKGRHQTLVFNGIGPEHTTIIALTNAISEQGYYVKRVIENPPRTGERAEVINRYWDIAGRRYEGVYPIDFHLVVTGEEVYRGEIRADAGTTRATLTIQGAYATAEMEAQIENTWEQICQIVIDTFEELPRARVTSFDASRDSGDEESSDVTNAPSWANHDRTSTLRQQLDQLVQGFVDGRISEGTFLTLKAHIERELQNMETDPI